MIFYRIITKFENGKQLTAQCEKTEKGYDHDAPYSYRKRKYKKLIDFDLKMPTLIVNPSIVGPTDNVIAIPLESTFKVFSLEMNDVFSKLNTPATMQIFDINLLYRREYLKYIACYIAQPSDEQCINFKKSDFILENRNKKISEVVKIDSYSELIELSREAISNKIQVHRNNLIINKNFNLDFFKITRFSGYYCSQKCVNLIAEKGLTGFAFEEIDVN